MLQYFLNMKQPPHAGQEREARSGRQVVNIGALRFDQLAWLNRIVSRGFYDKRDPEAVGAPDSVLLGMLHAAIDNVARDDLQAGKGVVPTLKDYDEPRGRELAASYAPFFARCNLALVVDVLTDLAFDKRVDAHEAATLARIELREHVLLEQAAAFQGKDRTVPLRNRLYVGSPRSRYDLRY